MGPAALRPGPVRTQRGADVDREPPAEPGARARGENRAGRARPIDPRARARSPPRRPTAQASGAMAADSTFHLREKLLSHAHELPSAYCL